MGQPLAERIDAGRADIDQDAGQIGAFTSIRAKSSQVRNSRTITGMKRRGGDLAVDARALVLRQRHDPGKCRA